MKTILVLFIFLAISFTCITQSDIEGPYYVPGAPTRNKIVCASNPAQDRLVLDGHVYRDCTNVPIANVKLDIWHANPLGQYSKGGSDYNCRAVLYTDNNGYYQFTTLMPGRYDDGGYRPAHIHFKIGASQYYNITTQLYYNLDPYVYPNDSCFSCGSDDDTLRIYLNHISDIKTYVGTWNVNLKSRSFENDYDVPQSKREGEGPNYIHKKDHILTQKTYSEEEVKKLLEEKDQVIESIRKNNED